MTENTHKITLPNYCHAEELINSISHGVGALFGITALVLCVVVSTLNNNVWGIVSGSIYGATLIILYSMSTIYHALRIEGARRVFRIFDHCSIFLLIAGTYTPYMLVSLRGPLGWTYFGIVWGAAILGIVLNVISVDKFKAISMACYIIAGWMIVFAFKPLCAIIDRPGIVLLLAGGIVYTIGAVLYALGSKIKFMHATWHIFVLAGSILHFFSILFYVL